LVRSSKLNFPVSKMRGITSCYGKYIINNTDKRGDRRRDSLNVSIVSTVITIKIIIDIDVPGVNIWRAVWKKTVLQLSNFNNLKTGWLVRHTKLKSLWSWIRSNSSSHQIGQSVACLSKFWVAWYKINSASKGSRVCSCCQCTNGRSRPSCWSSNY
jgi:hypothetical protein